MPAAEFNETKGASRFQRVGIAIAAVFYLASVGYVLFMGGAKDVLDPELETITFSHWQLEDGYREGVQEAIRRFEELKARQGRKVKVIQTTVPWRGYPQWFLTQLIGGEPADVMELIGNSQLYQKYFVPLSPYIDKPNPFNKGTPLEGLAWRDTYIDNMEGSLDAVYAEYFGVGHTFHTYRLFVNLDLLERATGSRKMPEDLAEWLDICEKLKAYGRAVGAPIIPIGVRGFDKATVRFLFQYYFSQLMGNLYDTYSWSPQSVQFADILELIEHDPETRQRVFAAVDIVRQLGQYFGKGFTAMDLEQTKFLFYSGVMAFFPEGTWNAWSMVNNSPFEVGITIVPPIGYKHKYSKYFTGKLTEAGSVVGGKIGIPKATKHFDLALEFLQFFTSYKINQMAMMDYAKWPAAVRKAQYKGILKSFQPDMEGNMSVEVPFGQYGYSSDRKWLECLEEIIVKNIADPGAYFLAGFKANKDLLVAEGTEFLNSYYRSNMDRELQRSQLSVALMNKSLPLPEAERLRFRRRIVEEGNSHKLGRQVMLMRYYQYIGRM